MITDTPSLRFGYLTFNGTEYVDGILGSELDDLSEFTVEALVWIDNFDAYNAIVCKGNIDSDTGWALEISTSGEATLTVSTTGGAAIAQDLAVTARTWTVVTAHYKNSTFTATVAVDGTWGASDSGSGAYNSEAGEQVVIGRSAAEARDLYGRIAWVAIYSGDKRGAGVNFTADQLPPSRSETNLIECWKFDHKSFKLDALVNSSHAGAIHSDEYAWAHGDWVSGWLDQSPTGTSADLRDATGDIVLQVQAELYFPTWVEQANWSGVSGVDNFDGIVCDDALVLGFADDGDLDMYSLADEDEADQNWSSAETLSPTPEVDTDINISLATDGSSVRVFYYDGTSIKYYESASKGVGSTWGAAVTVGALSSVLFLAATSLTRVHVGAGTSKSNVRLYCYDYNGGSWNQVASGIRWSTTPESFAAVSCPTTDITSVSGSDIIVMATDLPFVMGRRLQELELAYTMQQVKGLVFMRYQNGRWSEAWTYDWTDEPLNVLARARVKASSSGDWRFVTYQRIMGSPDYPQRSLCVARSKDGLRWEQPFIGATSSGVSVSYNYKHLVRGDHVYKIEPTIIYRSPLCGFFGDSVETMDLTDYVLQMAENLIDSNALQLTLANPNVPGVSSSPFRGELEYHTPRDPATASDESLLLDDVGLQLRLYLGYWVDGEGLGVQTGLFDVDFISRSRGKRESYIQIGANGIVNRLSTTNPDHTNEWETQTVAGDGFNTPDTTDFSGLRHSATISGSFDTPNAQGYLRNISSDEESIAFSTFLPDVWHGSITAGIYCANLAGSYVGVVIRGYDEDNLIYYAYSLNDNELQLIERRNGTDTELYSSAIGWNAETWYYLKIRFRYGIVYLYYSTDGAVWYSLTSWELSGMSASWSWAEGWTKWNANWTNWTAGGIPFMAGRVGVIANGYVDGGTETRIKEVIVNDNDWPVSLEDAIRTLGAFAGIHDYQFEALIDKDFDADIDISWLTVDGTWSGATGQLVGTGGGAAGHVYLLNYVDEELAPAFVAHFDLVSGAGGGFTFHGKDEANDCLAVWWDATYCGVAAISDAQTPTYLMRLPYGVTSVSGAGSSIIGHMTVKVGWQKDTLDDEKEYMLISLFVDGVEYFSYALDYAGGAYEWDGERIGFAIWGANTMTIDNFYVQQLHREVSYISVDSGEGPGEGLRRAIGSTRVRMSELPDGSLSVSQDMQYDSSWTIPHSRVDNFDERLDRIKTVTHIRILGATEILDYVDDCDVHGHRFHQIDDPNLVTEEEMWEEAQRQMANIKEDRHTASVLVQLQPLAQVWDRVLYNSTDWRVVGVQHMLTAQKQQTKLDLREYFAWAWG